jgi:hypothetical protein
MDKWHDRLMGCGMCGIPVQDSLICRSVTPGTVLQYASAGRITISAEEQGCPCQFMPLVGA